MKPLLACKCPPSMSMPEYIDTLFRDKSVIYGATPKIDGIRCLTLAQGFTVVARTRSLKPIPNLHVRQLLETLPAWLDGELTTGTDFQAVTSGIMSFAGTPEFIYWIFGCRINDPSIPYADIDESLSLLDLPPWCHILSPTYIASPEQLLEYEQQVLGNGAEGVMLRRFDKGYKYGRSTLREGHLIAIKRFVDSDAIVLDGRELMHNHNEATINALGLLERSHRKEGLIPAGKLGTFIVRDVHTNTEFEIGSGFTDEQRIDYWQRLDLIKGALLKYKYQAHGMKNKPRAPIFLGWRSGADL